MPDADSAAYSFHNNDIGEEVAAFVDRFGVNLDVPDRKTVGMLFFKRYCAFFAGVVYTWLHDRHPLNLSFQNIRYVLNGANMKYFIVSAEPLPAVAALTNEADRDEAYMRHVFREHAAPVIKAVASHTGVSTASLWHSVAYILAYWKQEWLLDSPSGEFRTRIGHWFDNAADLGKPAWLPERAVNPLTCGFREVADPLHEGRSILIRKACCLNYKRRDDDDPYCYTCPLISDELRLEKFMDAHAAN
ncbi:IucA/IucC family C-terminal-domain containing protein [Paenibacillus silvisoli]|uniref:IucA/IucC family C-terminal-domain containing protein n=1 Tax=Paenibacillus silvisoli TaxID=3110539 RepID=UPI0028045566|nr:IucA/IucC family C-terminal-domain containing protein [Paenibacillus silvisoli]